ILSFSPTSGKAGASVAIAGRNFIGTTSVKFSGVPTTFTVNTALKVTAKIPATARTGKITLTTAGGTATSGSNFQIIPTISSFTPTSGKVGASVTIAGKNFGGAIAVKFNGVKASFTVNSPLKITTKVPPSATTGKVTVTTAGGTATSGGNFTVLH